MPLITDNLYRGLSEGAVQAKTIINAISGASIAQIGNVVTADTVAQGTPEGSLLPEVSTTDELGGQTMGIEVGGVRKGIYDNFPLIEIDIPELIADSSFIAGNGEGVRVCTKGVCLGNLVCRSNDSISIGDSLTADAGVILFEGVLIFFDGKLRKATSGDFVIARALQEVPLGTPTDIQARVAAVNVQREGVLS
ncbi:MAG: hypothetical protein V3W20_12170 [Candidatus Neomarinimicrobiota bacterium]